MNKKLQGLLSLFQLKPVEMELFARILENGTITATELARLANITRTSVYDYLVRLKDSGLITQTLKNGVGKYAIEQPEKIQLLLNEHSEALLVAQEAIADLKDAHGLIQAKSKPQFQLCEGREELQHMMKDLLLYQNITVRAYWPILDIIRLLTPQFMETFHNERVKRNIKLKTIWPRTQVPSKQEYSFLKIGEPDKREVRLAPTGVAFSLGYALYENKIRFISSSRENFGFLIISNEFTEMMKGQFDVIWNNSEPFTF